MNALSGENGHPIPTPSKTGVAINELLERIRPALPADLPLYLVGGAVRDYLLRRPTRDLDFALPAQGIKTARKVADWLDTDVYPLDSQRDTGRVLIPQTDGKRLILDFATYRGPDLEADLRGRDFTVNSMAIDARDPSRFIDPLGGADDLRRKVLRACSPDSFSDDPLRVLRAVRLAVDLRFRIDPETRRWLAAAVPGLAEVSSERRRDEIFKMLEGPRVHAMLRMVEVLGLLPHTFPDLVAAEGVVQSAPHIYDVWQHSLAVLRELEDLLEYVAGPAQDPEAAAGLWMGLASLRLGRFREHFEAHLSEELIADRPWRPLLFLAVLYHDAGKPQTRTVDPDGRVRFLGHEEVGAGLIGRLARDLKFSNDEVRRLKAIVRHHMRPHHLIQTGKPPTRRAIYRFFRAAGPAGVDICLLVLADILGTYGSSLTQAIWEGYLDLCRMLLENWWEKPEESVSPMALLDGRDLIERFGVAPGPKIGELLRGLREAQATGEVADREAALRWVEARLEEDL